MMLAGATLAMGCTPRRPCSASEPCPAPESYVCLPDPTGDTPYCQLRCDPAIDGTICNDNGVCLYYGSGAACYPGGSRGLGNACSSTYDCVRGAICLRIGSAAPVCTAGCDLEGTLGPQRTCPTGSHCEPSTDASVGICIRDI